MYHLRLLVFSVAFGFLGQVAFGQTWQWARGNMGTGVDGWPVATDITGNIFACGLAWGPRSTSVTFGSVTLPAPTDECQCVIAKYDPAGNVIWAFGTTSGNVIPMAIATDPSGNLFMLATLNSSSAQVGTFTLTNSTGGPQFLLAKLSASGTVLWAKNDGFSVFGGAFLPPGADALGDGAIATDASGNCYITTNFYGVTTTVGTYTLHNHDLTGASNDFLVAKYNPGGTLQWAEALGGSGDDGAYGITVAPSGDIYLAGVFSSLSFVLGSVTLSTTTGPNAFIARLNSGGTPVWACGSGGLGLEYAEGISSDALNNVYVVGGFSDPSISFNGTTITNPYPGQSALYLAKFDPSNNMSWFKTIGSPTGADVWGYNASSSPCGDVWVSGDMADGQVSIDGNILNSPVFSSDPVFIAGYSSSGVYVGSAALQSGGDDQNAVACDASGNVFLCGDYLTSPFVVAGDTLPSLDVVSGGPEVLYVAKYAPTNITDTTFNKKDTIVCLADYMVINGPAGFKNYKWSNGKTSQDDTISASGTYWVMAFGSCSYATAIDTYLVTIISPDTVSKDTSISICGDSARLNAAAGYETYLWNTGATAAALNTTTPGTFTVKCTRTCGGLNETFHVTKSNLDISYSLGPDTLACEPFALNVALQGVSCTWQDGSTGNSYQVQTTGEYVVTVSEQGCSFTDSLKATVVNVAQSLPDTILCRETPVLLPLKANVPPGGVALWSTGSAGAAITVTDTGKYWVRVTDSVCIGSDTAYVHSEVCNCEAMVPNAFTPNDDGKNDFFNPLFVQGCTVTGYTFSIFNRWGQLVFFSQDPAGKWDGFFGGEKAELGVYMYELKYTAGYKNTNYFKKGDITLIR